MADTDIAHPSQSAAPTGTFAAQLVKAAGEQKTAAQTSKRECV